MKIDTYEVVRKTTITVAEVVFVKAPNAEAATLMAQCNPTAFPTRRCDYDGVKRPFGRNDDVNRLFPDDYEKVEYPAAHKVEPYARDNLSGMDKNHIVELED